MFGLLDVWVFGFFFLFFWVLQLCFQSVETDPKLDSEKTSVCVGIYSAFKGCAYIYIYIYGP